MAQRSKKTQPGSYHHENGAHVLSADTQAELTFRYYEDQWQHIRHLEMQLSTMTWQILLVIGGMATAYSQLASTEISARAGLGCLVFVMGAIGTLMAKRITAAARIHMLRARSARQAIQFVEQFARSESYKFASFYFWYIAIHWLEAITGIGLIIWALK